MGVQGAKPPAGARGVLATLSLSQSGPQARQMDYEWISEVSEWSLFTLLPVATRIALGTLFGFWLFLLHSIIHTRRSHGGKRNVPPSSRAPAFHLMQGTKLFREMESGKMIGPDQVDVFPGERQE